MITNSSIDKVKEVDIVSVIGSYISLKKEGTNIKALSPFVTEKTPSFVVSPSKQIWKDFSSGKGGRSVSFVMEFDKCSYPDAIRKIASIANIVIEETKLTEEEKAKYEKRLSLKELNNIVAKRYNNKFSVISKGHWAKEEASNRQFSKSSIINFEIGYAPDEWKFITKEVIEKAQLGPAKD